MQNPLFPTNQDEPDSNGLAHHASPPEINPAADLIRHKVAALYAEEPAAKQELREIKAQHKPLTKHQAFIQKLHESGRSLADIQTAWHNYYLGLPDGEKHEVWQEFYEAYNKRTQPGNTGPPVSISPVLPHSELPGGIVIADHQPPPSADRHKADSVADIRRRIVRRTQARSKLRPKHHLQSLLFGLGMGLVVVIVLLFGFFNEVIIAPFIQPSRHVSSTPLIITAGNAAASNTSEVIIPKINVEIPVDYSQTSTVESTIENALENGVVHYPSTVAPGQQGNAAFFGHSSNNILNPGKYKFAFVLLHELVPGDTFYLTYNSKVYVYQVFDRRIVPPSDVSVLNSTPGKTATATLITCDPPGTSINRLVVTGEQISPDPSTNTASSPSPAPTAQPAALPGNGPTLWTRLWRWL